MLKRRLFEGDRYTVVHEKKHTETGAVLVLIKETVHMTRTLPNKKPEPLVREYFSIGWKGWTGHKAVDDPYVRFVEKVYEKEQNNLDGLIERYLTHGPTKLKPRKKPTKYRDNQRARVYKWEKDQVFPMFMDQKLTMAEMETFVKLVWFDKYGQHSMPPEVKDGRGRRNAGGNRMMITMPLWSRNKAIVLHELAHSMTNDRHGPKFVAAYVTMLVKWLGFDRESLLRGLKDYNVEIGD